MDVSHAPSDHKECRKCRYTGPILKEYSTAVAFKYPYLRMMLIPIGLIPVLGWIIIALTCNPKEVCPQCGSEDLMYTGNQDNLSIWSERHATEQKFKKKRDLELFAILAIYLVLAIIWII